MLPERSVSFLLGGPGTPAVGHFVLHVVPPLLSTPHMHFGPQESVSIRWQCQGSGAFVSLLRDQACEGGRERCTQDLQVQPAPLLVSRKRPAGQPPLHASV